MRLSPVLTGLALIASVPAFAQFTSVAQPTAPYTSGTVLVPIAAGNLSQSGRVLSGGGQTLTFSQDLTARAIGSGWSNWGSTPATEGNANGTPVASSASANTFTITLTVPSTTFGFEWEPNSLTSAMTATFLSGSTSLGTITQTVDYRSALLFAATSTTPITSVTLSIPNGGNGGFAFARFRTVPAPVVTPVPAAGTATLCGLGILLLAGGAMLARKQNAAIQ